MSIKTVYSSKAGRDYALSPHFTLGEFACKNGADEVRYSTDLLDKLEELRSYGGFTVSINSGYRTAAYNKKIGGASNSQHIKGTAADIVIRKDGKVVNAKLICCLCQSLGFKGIGYISANAVHVDMRTSGSYRGDERKGYSGNVGGDFYKYFGIDKTQITALKVQETKQEVGVPVETEEQDKMYDDITKVPEWGRESVQLRTEHGWTDGKNLTDSILRCWVVEDRENPYIVNVEDAPAWAHEELQALIDNGKIKGNGVEQIGKRWHTLEALIMANR